MVNLLPLARNGDFGIPPPEVFRYYDELSRFREIPPTAREIYPTQKTTSR